MIDKERRMLIKELTNLIQVFATDEINKHLPYENYVEIKKLLTSCVQK